MIQLSLKLSLANLSSISTDNLPFLRFFKKVLNKLPILHAYAEKNPNFDLRLIDSTRDGYLNFENEDISDQTSIYMCGPLVMMEAISKSIKEKHPKAELIYEGFKFK